MQTAIPCLFMRGGTSRGPFFDEADLPADVATRDRVLLAVMGSPDRRQIDGLGGAHPLTSKVGIVRRSKTPGVDLDFLFAQLQPDRDTVDTTPNCGNMLAAVVPFALETGLADAQGDTTTLRVLTLNTGMQCDITVRTPMTPGGRHVAYAGDARIDGVPGSSSPITINFLDTAGSVCSGLLPTGRVLDEIDVPGVGRIPATCIDNGMPMVLFRAADMGRSGYEPVAELNADVEAVRRLADRSSDDGSVAAPGGKIVRERNHLQFLPAGLDGEAGGVWQHALGLGTTIETPGGWRITLGEAASGENLMPGPRLCLVDAGALPGALAVRNRRPGDVIRLHGLGGRTSLKRLFASRRVPRRERADHPVVVCDQEVLWVPDCGRSETALVEDATTRRWVLRAHRHPKVVA